MLTEAGGQEALEVRRAMVLEDNNVGVDISLRIKPSTARQPHDPKGYSLSSYDLAMYKCKKVEFATKKGGGGSLQTGFVLTFDYFRGYFEIKPFNFNIS